MKKLFLLLLLLLSLCFELYAAPISPNQALQVAQNFISFSLNSPTNQHNNRAPSRQKRITQHSFYNANQHFYIFNCDEGDGFVIVSGEDCATPVLGYSEESCLDLNNVPIQLEELLQAYSDEIQYAIENNFQATDSIKNLWRLYTNSPQALQTTIVVNPLISTKWNQFPYYNSLCPTDASFSSLGGHPATGCVATAMAQVMKYWGYPQRGVGHKSYNSDHYGTLSANFANTEYDWTNMPLKLSHSTSSAQNTAVATLMYHCGVAVSMRYNSDGMGSSGAYLVDLGGGRASAEKSLKTYFGYATTTAGKIWDQSISTTTWKNLLKNELDNQRPILYAGYSSSGSGHAFVCDGYDSNDFFHFNWGWGGSADGYFSLTALTPGSSNYSVNQQAVIGIKPIDGSGPAKNYDLYMNTDLTATNTSSTGSSMDINPYYYGNTISFAAKIENNGTGVFNGSFRVAAFSYEGEFIAWSKELFHGSVGANNVTERMIFTFDGGIPFIPGKYRAYMYYKDDNESDWNLVKTDEGVFLTEYNNVIFTVKAAYTDLKPSSSFNIALGDFITDSRVRIEVNVKNAALFSSFYGKIGLSLINFEGKQVNTIDELDYSSGFPPNTTYNLSFTGFIDVEPGSYYLALKYKESNENSWYYMGCIDSYPNPVKINVVAPVLCADDHEVNNTQATATTLNWEIDPEMPDFSTLQVSLHEEKDVDYYKLSFLSQNRYTINVHLHDRYNKGSQWYENADARFEYSLGGNAYSFYCKDSTSITFNGPITLYIKVSPYGLNGLGYYELVGEIVESDKSAFVDVYCKDKKTQKLFDNGHLYILLPDGTRYSATGKKVE